jgi:hypothetical protein
MLVPTTMIASGLVRRSELTTAPIASSSGLCSLYKQSSAEASQFHDCVYQRCSCGLSPSPHKQYRKVAQAQKRRLKIGEMIALEQTIFSRPPCSWTVRGHGPLTPRGTDVASGGREVSIPSTFWVYRRINLPSCARVARRWWCWVSGLYKMGKRADHIVKRRGGGVASIYGRIE